MLTEQRETMEQYVGQAKAFEVAGRELEVGEVVNLDGGGYVRCLQHPSGMVQFLIADAGAAS